MTKKLVTRVAMLVGAGIMAFGLAGIAVATTPAELSEMQYVVAENTEVGTSLMTVYGFLPDDTSLPATAHFYAPSDFLLVNVFGLTLEEDSREVVVSHTATEEDNGFTRYDVVFTESTMFIASFVLDAKIYDTTVMGGPSAAPIAELEVLPPNDLELLTIGFVAPEGYAGVGQGVTQLGTDYDGNEIYGIDYTNVPGDEVIVAVVAFGQQFEQVEFNAENVALATVWYEEPFTWIMGALIFAAAGLAVVLYLILTCKGPFASRSDVGTHDVQDSDTPANTDTTTSDEEASAR
ncbi:MAG: hypothetical protein FWG78_00770 [Coriobacteriia bacterium]|nr:hypothetical protein [Coriobacteriia bacterium]